MADVGDIRPTAAPWHPRDRRSRQQPGAPRRRTGRIAAGRENPEDESHQPKKGHDATRGTKFDEFA